MTRLASNDIMKFKKVAIVLGIFLLIGPLVSMLELLSNSGNVERSLVIFIVVQLLLALVFLITTFRLNLDRQSTLLPFRYSCYSVLLYIFVFCLVMLRRTYQNFGFSILAIISVLVAVLALTIPFIWFIRKAR